MKKKLAFIIILMIPIIFFTVLLGSLKIKANEKADSLKYGREMLLFPVGKQNEEDMKEVNDGLSNIPANINEKLSKKGLLIYITNKPITELTEFSTLKHQYYLGMNFDEQKGIFLNNIIGFRVGYGITSGTLEHEVGHAVDACLLNKISDTEEFMNIYNREKEKLFPRDYESYYAANSFEYFAQIFSMYYRLPQSKKELKERAPQSYNFIKDLEKKLK